ncbi:TPA: hypothetical protein I8Y34_004796 [Raoultella ornithinolytica]|nr:hypothetical protein [Raoultella ornithinolytica]
MYKLVLVLLPGLEPKIITMEQNLDVYQCYGVDPKGNHGQINIPIETFSYQDSEYLIARFKYDLSDEEIIKGIKQVGW